MGIGDAAQGQQKLLGRTFGECGSEVSRGQLGIAEFCLQVFS